MPSLPQDELRNPAWYYRAFRFLADRYPHKYSMTADSFLEGLFIHIYLYENKSNRVIGKPVRRNTRTGEFDFLGGSYANREFVPLYLAPPHY